MPVSVVLQDVLDLLAGTHTGTDPTGTSTFFGVAIPDATVHARAIDVATLTTNLDLGESVITAHQPEANKLAQLRAAREVLNHIRTTILSGGLVQSYSLGKLSVTRANVLQALTDSYNALVLTENDLYAKLVPGGTVSTQRDLIIQPAGWQPTSGVATIGDAAPGYGSASWDGRMP